MKSITAFILRHRRMLLIALLSVTLLVSSEASRRQLQQDAVFTSLPIQRTYSSPAAAFAASCSDQHDRDVAALRALIDRDDIDDVTRNDAADLLASMISDRTRQRALEDALAATSLAPCAAVVTGDSVTLITGKERITPAESALVITLAALHCGAEAENIRILTGQ